MDNFNSLTEQQIAQRLSKHIPPTHDMPTIPGNIEYRNASVLIPFVRIEDAWHILFIKRSKSAKDPHSGQVAFAGGKYESEDGSLEATALRETQEEIGITPNDVRILGQLSHHYSISKFQITPVVGIIPWPYRLKLNASEVSDTFTLPLNWLADSSNYEVRKRQLSISQQAVPIVYFNQYEGELLWGATARMTLSLIDTLRT